MITPESNELFHQLESVLDSCYPADWGDIHTLLNQIKYRKKPSIIPSNEQYLEYFSRGTAIITFSYGIDGVSIETSKYARILCNLFSSTGIPSIYLIGGNFKPHTSSFLSPEWHRYQIEGIDGWNKWDNGRWFNALYRKEMKAFSDGSNLLTKEIFKQAVSIAKHLGKYFIDHQISLVIPVNIASNPGNLSLTLGLVLVTEILGVYVLNSNHDFYWEAGKPLSEREHGEKPGVRDHFFRNIDNKTFAALFRSLYPWNGSRWLQVNINARQSRKLCQEFDFPVGKVYEISTCLADTFFEDCNKNDVLDIRQRMGYILSAGEAIMQPVPLADHLARIDEWMTIQQPVILGARAGLSVDPRSADLLIMLQPTRIVGRKRIYRNLELIEALFRRSGLRHEFENNPNRQLILHITGPTPKEHQKDLEKILYAYQETVGGLPEVLADRIYLAFSVGHDACASQINKPVEPLTIESIYRMADVVVFPSKTEGRGLPIIEACASGIPIICSHYRPREVFSDVIGDELPEELQLRYTLFPEGKFHDAFLTEVADLLIKPGEKQSIVTHNTEAVRARYSHDALKTKFERILHQLSKLDLEN